MSTLAPTVKHNLFENALRQERLIKNREVLRPSYTPATVVGREDAMTALVEKLVPVLHGEAPANTHVVGADGVGKTVLVRRVAQDLSAIAAERGAPVKVVYLDGEQTDTSYRVLANLANHFISEWNDRIPFTGWPTEDVYKKLIHQIVQNGEHVVIILDAVQAAIAKAGDDLLYLLSKLDHDVGAKWNETRNTGTTPRVGIVTVSRANDNILSYIDPRLKTRLFEATITVHPADNHTMRVMLHERISLAFSGGLTAVPEEVVNIIAARANGNAQRAIDLLRTTAEVAERGGHRRLDEPALRQAENLLRVDKLTTDLKSLPAQHKLVLIATMKEAEKNKGAGVTTGEVYDTYRDLCPVVNLTVLTQRRVTDLISELDTMRILTARVISKGRYGRTKEIKLDVELALAQRLLKDDAEMAPCFEQ